MSNPEDWILHYIRTYFYFTQNCQKCYQGYMLHIKFDEAHSIMVLCLWSLINVQDAWSYNVSFF